MLGLWGHQALGLQVQHCRRQLACWQQGFLVDLAQQAEVASGLICMLAIQRSSMRGAHNIVLSLGIAIISLSKQLKDNVLPRSAQSFTVGTACIA